MADTTAAAEADAEQATAASSEANEAMLARLQGELGDALLAHGDARGLLVVRVQRDVWKNVAHFARRGLGYDYLSFIAGIDWMPAPVLSEEGSGDTSSPVQPRETTYGVAGSDGRFQVFALVESTGSQPDLAFKADLDENDLRVESWVSVYPGADWHERECWEMFGFRFDGHPSLRNLYLPSGFEGHPLRKDFPLLAREVKPWPGLVDVEAMPGDASGGDEEGGGEAAS